LKCPDDAKTELSVPKRGTRVEVQPLVAEFVSWQLYWPSGRRIEVHFDFDTNTFERLVSALDYGLGLWRKLTRFLEYPELELSNNLAENSVRPVALGRKNWIHIGRAQAGPKVAAIFPVVESCHRLKVPVRDYFSAILPGLADLPIRCLKDLTPTVWVARHSSTQATGN